MNFTIFNEEFYLQSYPDVKAAVDAGVFPSGLAHFQQFGLAEGRTLVAENYSESAYLAANPDVAAAVQNNTLGSGLEHYIFLGEAEGRSLGNAPSAPSAPSATRGAGFNELAYLMANRDVANAVSSGALGSGWEHYQFFGQFEGRLGVFAGTPGNDRIEAFGQQTFVMGVGVEDGIRTSLGIGEMDTLIGGEGEDEFELVVGSGSSATSMYVGNGDADFALIQNFDPNKDSLHLAGTLSDYQLQPSNGSLNIATVGGDLVAIVEGVSTLEQESSFEDNTFSLSGSNLPGAESTEAGFNEQLYLMTYPDIANAVAAGAIGSGLEHYQLAGQFEGRVAAFTGTPGNDRIMGFGQGAFVSGVGTQPIEVVERFDREAGDFDLLDVGLVDGIPTSLGTGEVDTLIGSTARDVFVLASGASSSGPPTSFYLGNGDADFALIQNFNPNEDYLYLALGVIDDYQSQEVNGSLNILNTGGDLIAIVEGITPVDLQPGINLL